ncbi:putative late blight resistance protein homolog r1a-4 [Phtheirospermum japonicum]|uniref:Putative late blight resistance protein homolog r1a-4 n=1 Tax=Phtheirospermum japonicum TaxID=374723 RepID=A0A830D343_9LAMI|nr:putative late blight resistance protein homolog r1a-4 [Phtheirospermum japonicum]
MACAAVVSVKQKLEHLLSPSQSGIILPISELESICEDISHWQSFLEAISSSQSNDRAHALQTQIKDLAHELEDLMESYISDWFISGSDSYGDVSLTFRFFQEIVQIKPKINSLTKRLKAHTGGHQPSSSRATRFDFGERMMKMVGLEDELEEIKNRALGGPDELSVIPIVGMAGIGKTTHAKEVYYDPTVLDHFELRLFLTVGPEYEIKKLLLLALDQLGFGIDEMSGKMEAELGRNLLRCLSGRRYLVVLDDIWNTQVWYKLERFFPDNRKGSRIIMTTRLVDVARCAGTCTRVPFLNDDESWNLLRKTVFTSDQESSLCDYQLEKIGRKIAKKCEGLPLAIIEVGKILRETERKVESWKEISEREDPLVITIDDDTPISKTLSLSYKMLPQRLKSCFLYMGVFPKDYEIRTSKLSNLWVSEGFIEQQLLLSSSQRLERKAKEYLDDLVLRNLVMVCKESSSGCGIKSCRIHFVFRNICISEARNQNLFHVIKKYPESFPDRPRGLCFHNNTVLGFKQVHNSLMKSVPTERSLLCFGPQHQHPLRVYLHFPSLRVLDAVTIRFYKFPHQVVELVELRYLAITYDGEIPASISALCYLEVLIVRRHHESLKYSEAPVYLPMEIWKLRKLRHLQCMGYDLPDPSKEDGFDGSVTLENLSTLSGVSAHSCNRSVLERIPNLMKLGIQVESPDDMIDISNLFRDFKLLKHLKSFKCVVVNPGIGSQVASIAPYFPTNLRKITLSGCEFSWCDMTYIGSNPNLEVLKLRRCAFQGPEWATNEYEFRDLKFLLLEDLDIEHWITNPRHFPDLRHLIIRHCYKLRKIPLRKECYSELIMIEVDDCSPPVMISAQHIQEQQKQRYRIRNNSLELQIHYSWDDKRLKP